jgi:hypothetical protein
LGWCSPPSSPPAAYVHLGRCHVGPDTARLWFFVALQPVAGVVFALAGVLLGAGDAAFLRRSTLISALLGYLPVVWALSRSIGD